MVLNDEYRYSVLLIKNRNKESSNLQVQKTQLYCFCKIENITYREIIDKRNYCFLYQ
jgi:hypothetical protein